MIAPIRGKQTNYNYMKTLKREMYHFNGKDYERFDLVELTFNVQRISLENFLNTIRLNYCNYFIGNYFEDSLHTWVDNKMKPIKVSGFAYKMYEVVKSIGFSDYNEILDNIFVRKHELRKEIATSYSVIFKVEFCNGRIFYLYNNFGELLLKSINNKILKFKDFSTYKTPRMKVNFTNF